jgi:6-phospho-beta-glucosidase
MVVKLTIIGGGSSYTPELVQGVIDQHETLPFDEICLMDINEERLKILTGLSERMVGSSGRDVRVWSTTDRRQALEDASFVNCLVRVGGMDARINDERIPLQYGIVGQETTGPGGMMKALRTIPPMLELAHEMVTVCPDAWLINYTNPSGIIAEALGKHSQVQFVGLCSGPTGWIDWLLTLMEVPPERAVVDWVGLNHLGFAVRVYVDGQDATEQAVEAAAGHWSVDADWLRVLGAIPASYLQYYYHHDRIVEKATAPGSRTRGEEVKEIEAELLRQYTDPDLDHKPALLQERGGGGYAEVAMAAMRAIHHNTGECQYIQTLNRGAVEGIPPDASVEIACMVDQAGPRPIHFGPLPLPVRGLIQSVKSYESLTVQAAVEESRRVALQALMAHPFTPSWDVAKPLLDDLLAANQAWIPWA